MRLGGKKAGPPIRAGLLVLFCMGDPDSYRFIGKGTAEKNDSLFPERDIRFLAEAPFRGSWKMPNLRFPFGKALRNTAAACGGNGFGVATAGNGTLEPGCGHPDVYGY